MKIYEKIERAEKALEEEIDSLPVKKAAAIRSAMADLEELRREQQRMLLDFSAHH